MKRAKSPKQQKYMNTQDINKNTEAPSVTIAPRNPARGVLLYVVTLTGRKDVRAYPCRSLEKATNLAARFIAGVTKPVRRSEPQQPDDNPDRYDGPPRTAEQVAA
jgi:hypothetical protein